MALLPGEKATPKGQSLLLSSLHYVVMASIGATRKCMIPSKVFVNTGSGYNVIGHDALPPEGQRLLNLGADQPRSNHHDLCAGVPRCRLAPANRHTGVRRSRANTRRRARLC